MEVLKPPNHKIFQLINCIKVLPMKVCKNLIVAGKYNFVGKNELCAGKKKFFKKIKMFTRAGDGFKFTGEVTNYLGTIRIFNSIAMAHLKKNVHWLNPQFSSGSIKTCLYTNQNIIPLILPLSTGLNDDGNYPYEYYISGTDSCNGDSGGPVYRWVDGVPTLIAVVARYSDICILTLDRYV